MKTVLQKLFEKWWIYPWRKVSVSGPELKKSDVSEKSDILKEGKLLNEKRAVWMLI